MLSFSTSGCGLGWEYKIETKCTPHLHAGEVERLDAYQILISIEEKLRKINEILSFLNLSTRKIVRGSICLMLSEDFHAPSCCRRWFVHSRLISLLNCWCFDVEISISDRLRSEFHWENQSTSLNSMRIL